MADWVSLYYALDISANGKNDLAVFGDSGKRVLYEKGKFVSNADFAIVRRDKSGAINSISWVNGQELAVDGKTIAVSSAVVPNLVVKYGDKSVSLDVSSPERSLAIFVGKNKKVVVNGKVIDKLRLKEGYFYPFADMPLEVIADDADSFNRITEGEEWEIASDPNAWRGKYTVHETDPGRQENGYFVVQVPKSGKYRILTHLPKVSKDVSNKVEYRIEAGGIPARVGNAVVAVRKDGSAKHLLL